jgi:putative transposase
MSGRGYCYDNAVVEKFFGLLKRERVNRVRYRMIEEECFYNLKRRHSYIGYISPVDYEKQETGLN